MRLPTSTSVSHCSWSSETLMRRSLPNHSGRSDHSGRSVTLATVPPPSGSAPSGPAGPPPLPAPPLPAARRRCRPGRRRSRRPATRQGRAIFPPGRPPGAARRAHRGRRRAPPAPPALGPPPVGAAGRAWGRRRRAAPAPPRAASGPRPWRTRSRRRTAARSWRPARRRWCWRWPSWSSLAGPLTGSRFGPLELGLAVAGGELLDDPVEALALEHAGEVADGQADAVVGDPVLGEVVGADALGAVQRADLRATLGGELGLLVGDRPVQQAGAEHAQRLLPVLDLRLLVLHGDHDAGGQVGDADRRVGGVDRLPARPGRAVHVDLEVGRVDLDIDLLRLGQHVHAGGRGVDAPLRLGDRHALHAVHARFELEPGPCPSAMNGEHDLLEAAVEVGQALREDLDLVAVLLRPARVHPEQVAGEQGGLVPAGARADLEDHVLVVVGVLGRERVPQLDLERVEALLGGAQLVLEEGAALGRALLAQELPAGVQVALGRLPRPVGADHLAELRVTLRQLDEVLVVGEHRGIAELILDRGVGLLYFIESWGEHCLLLLTVLLRNLLVG